ncbi:hypothetical protein [Nocardia sp. NBC_01388]|uniref:hypothetical protein n=1 Tax=Nocardia sp. NBC_01388 TaxID=2903596 RepID=UPI003252C6CE
MSDLRTYAALTAVPALLAFGSGTAAAQSADLPRPATSLLEMPTAAADPSSPPPAPVAVQLPEGLDPQLRDQAQSYVDGVQQQITTAYNNIGFPQSESDRRSTSTTAGGVLGALIGKVAVFPLEIVGCGVGTAVGAVAGAVIGALPTVGAGAPVGAAVGGVSGCLLGGLAVAIPVDIAGLVGGAVIGGLAGSALGSGTDPAPAAAPIPDANAQAPQSDPPEPAPITTAVDAVAAGTKPAVTSLRTAIAAMSPLTPGALGPLTQPANDLLAAVQAAI